MEKEYHHDPNEYQGKRKSQVIFSEGVGGYGLFAVLVLFGGVGIVRAICPQWFIG